MELSDAPQVPHEWIDGPERVRSRCMDENDRDGMRDKQRRFHAGEKEKSQEGKKELLGAVPDAGRGLVFDSF